MKPRLFTPGPTPVPEETLLELARPVTYHRSAEAKAILAEVSDDLKYVFQTANPVFTLTSSGTDEGYIVSVYVAPAWRRRGLASALTDTAIAYAREVGMARVRLHATPVGREVYERAGFSRRDDAMEIELTASADVWPSAGALRCWRSTGRRTQDWSALKD